MSKTSEEELYQEIPHTGDIAIQMSASSLKRLFEKAGLSLYALLVERGGVEEAEEISVEATGETNEELMVEWLSQLLKRFNVSEFIGRRIEISSFGHGSLSARIWGERFDPGRHEFQTEIKGVTYHELSVVQDSTGWKAQVVFDV